MITSEQVYSAVEKDGKEKGDFHRWLGASMIGHPCARYVSLSFHCAFDNDFSGRTFLIFDLGNLCEDLICNALAKAGIEVTERQRMFDMPGGMGHAGATIDGLASDGLEYYLLEMKTSNAKAWKELHEKGVKAAKPQHYGQMQFGMDLTELRKALYVSINKDTCELHIEVVDYDAGQAEKLHFMARSVIGREELPKMSERPDYFECKWCAAHRICHGHQMPRVHCLTCAHARAVEFGKWHCGYLENIEIPNKHLPDGCPFHVFMPWMVNLPVLGYGEYWVMYQGKTGRICNCPTDQFPTIDGGDAPDMMTSQMMLQKSKEGAL